MDDNQVILKTVSMKLTSAGYDVVTAEDGGTAVSTVRREKPDLILLDIMMPKIDGYQVAQELRKNAKELKIVYVSIKPLPEVNMENADGFVQKPFAIGDIVSTAKNMAR